jgi:hypothetical protein
VHVEIVAESSASGYGVVLVLVNQLLEGIGGFGVDDCVFFNPPDLILCGLDLEKTAASSYDLKLLPVGDKSHAAGDGGNAVVKVGLAGADVNRIVRLMTEL